MRRTPTAPARPLMAQQYIRTILEHAALRRAGRAVLRDVGWTIAPGERWILAGANGAGKTQLLKLVAGSVWPTPTGRERRCYIWRGERYPTPFEVREEIAYLGPERQDRYERYGWNFTAAEIVATGLGRTDIPQGPLTVRDRREVARLLARLSLVQLGERRFLTLSYGERRLVLLARALASRPRLLLLDELLSGLDAANHAAALGWLASTGRSRLPWVLATHRLEEVPRGATHALVLAAGRVVYRGRIARAPLARWLGVPEAEPEVVSAAERIAAPMRRAHPARVRRVRDGLGSPLVRLLGASVYLDERVVLYNLSLEIARGECWVVHGPNGSGKSTLLRTVYGDHAVAAGGRIERAGIEPGVALDVFKRTVGFIAPHVQSRAVAMRSVLREARARSASSIEPRDLTVSEVVESGRRASLGLDEPSSRADRQAAREALAAFGLAALAERPLPELSYGQLRRVLFARAWVNRPRLLLLDEPFTGIDAPTRRVLAERLAVAIAGGTTVVMATHHRQEWPRGATHELELCAGRGRYCGPVRLHERIHERA
ncbi:MAG: ATP-binding cassette domain-containing protein [Steroidobacteraceae bacterium]